MSGDARCDWPLRLSDRILHSPFVSAWAFVMIDVQKSELVLTRMTELLLLGSRGSWATALEKHRSVLSKDPTATAAGLLKMLGGMGSLNDVVLYKDGQPMADENREFSALRSRLYDLCHRG